MKVALSRGGLIGLAVGATAGMAVIAFIVVREVRRRRSKQAAPLRAGAADGRAGVPPPLLPDRLEGGGSTVMQLDNRVVEAQQQALAAVEAVVQGLTPQQQLELRKQLDQVLHCVTSLRSEVAELKGGLKDIATQIVHDVKRGVEDGQRSRRRRTPMHRERTNSTSSSSIYFTATPYQSSSYGDTSEGGYSTAYGDSDHTDRDTDKEEAEPRPEPESGQEEEEGEEEEDQSCATVLTLRQEDSPEEDEEDEEDEEEEEEEEVEQIPHLQSDIPSGELALLLAQSDILHTGDASLKAEGFRLLQDNRVEHGNSREFVWRLARAFVDMYTSTPDKLQKMSYAQKGREEAEAALKKNGYSADCHKWFAILVGMCSEYESTHSKLKSSYILKEHLDRALSLRDDDPVCYFLLGRWCQQVASLDWLEQKAAAALYKNTPSSSLNDALENFLKAEELSPGFSRSVRLYIAKCHQELGNTCAASNWAQLALKTNPGCSDALTDAEEMRRLEAQLRNLSSGDM